jgi:hypothetical protein
MYSSGERSPILQFCKFNKGIFCLSGMHEGSGKLLEHVVPEEFIVIRMCGCNKIAIVINISQLHGAPRVLLAAEPSL